MTSRTDARVAYVWVWLPEATEPVPAGVLEQVGDVAFFNYGRSYLERENAIALYLPELPLERGRQRPGAGLSMAGCFRDAGPDAWGRRVVRHRLLKSADSSDEQTEPSELAYLLESSSNRVGALDFQASPHFYEPRLGGATLQELQVAAQSLEQGDPISFDLDAALVQGSALGGARPKAMLDDGRRQLIAKFSSRTDSFPVIKGEGVAMELARRVGLHVAASEVTESLGRDVLLVERFDRTSTSGERKMIVSALTMLGLDEMFARYATYFDLVPLMQERFTNAETSIHELFARIVFNICVGNTDDHARNHAAFWNGAELTLTPAYDICPQTRSGGEAVQAMAISPGQRFSQLRVCLDASSRYFLSTSAAREIIDHQLDVITSQWREAADVARLTNVERAQLWGRQILNPYALEGWGVRAGTTRSAPSPRQES